MWLLPLQHEGVSNAHQNARCCEDARNPKGGGLPKRSRTSMHGVGVGTAMQ